jgi:hypothetical protein
MSSQPPSFASRDYWERRFAHNKRPFDWLLSASSLDSQIIEAISVSAKSNPRILHIGCGTSLLSFHLRSHVNNPTLVHNIDFSANAIEWGRNNEHQIIKYSVENWAAKMDDVSVLEKVNETSGGSRATMKEETMQWSQVSLLSLSSILSACKISSYSLIVDKSCSDAIACGEDIEVSVPFAVHEHSSEDSPSSSGPPRSFFVQPIYILALHLALVVPPGARWVALSYSEDRFSFCIPTRRIDDYLPPKLLAEGFPNPSRFWRLVRKESINAVEEANTESSGVVYRPRISHWVFVLERTSCPLEISPQMTEKAEVSS